MTHLALLPLVLAVGVHVSQSGTLWQVESGTDPMTDGMTVSATASSSAGPHTYELRLNCTVAPDKTFKGSFTTAVFLNGEGATIPWEVIGSQLLRPLTFRIDSGVAGGGSLVQDQYSNEGMLGIHREGADKEVFATRLPAQRLLLSGIFPNETVAFDFTSLTAEQRKAIETYCFLGGVPRNP